MYIYIYIYIVPLQNKTLASGILTPEIQLGPDLRFWHTGLTHNKTKFMTYR